MATMVMVSVGSSFRMRRISLWATALDGVKKDENDGGSGDLAGPLVLSMKRDRHVSAGLRSGC